VLIVGAGRIAGLNELDPVRRKPCTHAGMVLANDELALAGVVDVDKRAADQFAAHFAIGFAGTDLADALARVRPDVVTVAVPYHLQFDVVLSICEARHRPRTVLLEKPLADTFERARAMIQRCEDANVKVLVNNECAAPIYERIKQLIRERYNNDVISVTAWCSSGMHAVGVHMIGVMLTLFGRVRWVHAVLEREYVASLPFSTNFVPDDPRVQGLLVFESGLVGFLMNSALTSYTYKELEVTCRAGKLRLSDNGAVLRLWSTAIPGESTLSHRLSDPIEDEGVPGTAFDVMGNWLATGGDAGQHVIGAERALETYQVLDALVQSGRESRPVHLRRVRPGLETESES
jgi:predicted dehydrogenase